ncbi:uncharacterized protein [Aegilops tauschii subsp. strangulata]|uniref:uncharacterized protein n=1 Tax=Aegilops tauschii subsp. strangulata TaxID=200361 RepID=UPI001ABC295C|nr:uncharacterized protein LOC109786750 isoform X2 [Aegilops tauschii subsp. strangulata]
MAVQTGWIRHGDPGSRPRACPSLPEQDGNHDMPCSSTTELQDSRFSRDQLQPSFSFCYVNQFVMASKSTWLVQSKFYTRAVVSVDFAAVDFAARQSAITSADFAVRSSAVAWTYFGAGPEGKRQQKQEPKAQSRKVEPSTKILFLQL